MIGIIDFNDWELVITNAEPVRNKKHYAAVAKGPEEMLFSEDALAPVSYTHLTLPTSDLV